MNFALAKDQSIRQNAESKHFKYPSDYSETFYNLVDLSLPRRMATQQ